MRPDIAHMADGTGCASGRGDEKVCRSRGGESCAFDGAMIVLQPIADAAHVVHGPIACLGNSWEGRGSLSRRGALDRMGFTTDLSEMDIVYGAEEKLAEAVREVVRRTSPRAVFVHATCVSGLTGEDIASVARRMAGELSLPVIAVQAPGFVGPKNLGNRIAGEVLLEHVIGSAEPAGPLTGAEINLIGEYNIAGDLWLVEPLLLEAGIRVLARMTGDATYGEITHAHRARLNVMVCSRALINIATGMERRWGIPFVEGSFFGPAQMARTLRAIAAALGIEEVARAVEGIIAREEARARLAVEPYAHLRGRRAVLYTGGVKSWAMASALRDLGVELVAVGTRKSTAEDEEKLRAILGPDAPLEENVTPAALLGLMRERHADILVAGGRNIYLGAKEGFPCLDVNQERHTPYAGYEGFVNLARDIDTTINFYRGRRAEPAPLVQTRRALSMDPLKHSRSIGAALALQGVDGTLPVLHGAQGCAFLGKVLLAKHFREPIAMASTKLFAEDVVMGSEERLAKAVRESIAKQSPSLVGVITTGLTEVKGDDPAPALAGVARETSTPVVLIPTPDYDGGLEDGFAGAVEALVAALVPEHPGPPEAGLINILAGPHLSPEDCNELRALAGCFGLRAIVLPDLSALDGSSEGFSGLAHGGVSVRDVALMGRAGLTIALGACMERAASMLEKRAGVPHLVLRGVTGLAATDELVRVLARFGGRAVPEAIERRRRILRDAMRDAQLIFGGRRVCLALEPAQAESLAGFLAELGADVTRAVLPQRPPYDCRIAARSVVVGDLTDIDGGCDLIVSGSHAARAAAALGVPLWEAGFPAWRRFGAAGCASVGYRGSYAALCEAANLIEEGHR
jgi:nitrogenase molybdenum-iron cofactor biosynthesis protein NifE/nitrogenase molybdenum-iron cofactor biosynthesis protein NifN